MVANTKLKMAREQETIEELPMSRELMDFLIKWGHLAEDFILPDVERIFEELVGCPSSRIRMTAGRITGRSTVNPSQTMTFEGVGECDNYLLLNVMERKLDIADIERFIQKLPSVPEYFPIYAGYQIMGIVASFHLQESVVRYAERQGLIVLGFGEGNMDVLNSEGFTPKNFAPMT